jgi:uncharacterized cupredoxin-like copper-binding protein
MQPCQPSHPPPTHLLVAAARAVVAKAAKHMADVVKTEAINDIVEAIDLVTQAVEVADALAAEAAAQAAAAAQAVETEAEEDAAEEDADDFETEAQAHAAKRHRHSR